MRLILTIVYVLCLLVAGALFTLAVRRFLRSDDEEDGGEAGDGDGGGIPGGDSLPGGDRPPGESIDLVVSEVPDRKAV